MTYKREIRLAELRDEIADNRTGYFLSELALQAQGCFPSRQDKEEIVRMVINALTNNKETSYKKVFVKLLNVLTPTFYTKDFISKIPDKKRPSHALIMIYLWQSLRDKEEGYPLEMNVANTCVLIAKKLIIENGEIVICPRNQKSTPERKS